MGQKYEDFLKEILKNCKFDDVFDLNDIQELQDEFAYSMQIASVITDLDGNPLTKPSNFCDFCEKIVRNSPVGLSQCMHSDAVLGNSNIDGFTVSRCLSAGLMDAGVSITVGDMHIANWLFGQIRDEYEILDENELTKRAIELCIEPDIFIEEYKKVHVVSRERFEHIANFVYLICDRLSVIAYQKCVQDANIRYREMIEWEMKEERTKLELSSSYDTLTGLFNRNHFESQLDKYQLLGTVPMAVVMGDVNHLKLTNDIFGHRFGDQLLHEIASVMLEESFDGYIIGRSGGDEFNVLIPGGNRQDAEWFCHRVRIELDKKINCCVRPSIAFGVAKKGSKEEDIRNTMELADIKMYRNKIEIKSNEHVLDDIKMILKKRGYITTALYERTNAMSRAFGTRIGLDGNKLKAFSRMMRIHDYGMIILEEDLFRRRFYDNLDIEEKRELKKHCIVGSRIAKLEENYAELSDAILNSHQHWDGSGYPENMKGENIPLFSRMARIIDDYIIATEQPPLGTGHTKEEAIELIRTHSGTYYEPGLAEKFLEFIADYEELNQ